MNFGTEPMSSTMSPYLSGTNSPIPGNPSGKPNNNGSLMNHVPSSMAMAAAAAAAAAAANPTAGTSKSSGYSSPALAYANAQLSQYAQHQSPSQQPRQMGNGNMMANHVPGSQYANFFATQGTALPAHLNPHALSAALADYSSHSIPNSASSSPGQQYKRLAGAGMAPGFASGTATGASTPGGNSRVAASAITGKRLNWSEMICQTIAESESGRLVIQDLFEGMCNKFPEIREWAFGKDWEGRVKNRIKSTLSIKGNLFVKVPRPSSASGKGSWWTLSQEAQDAWKEGRMASIVKSGAHSRSVSQSRTFDGITPLSGNTSRAGSRAPSRRGSPVSSRGPSTQHANQHSHTNSRGAPHQGYVNFGQDKPNTGNSPGTNHSNSSNSNRQSPSATHRQSPSANLPAGLGMSPITFGSNSFEGLSMTSLTGLDDMEEPSAEPSARRMRMMENSVNDSFDSTVSSNPSGLDGLSASMGLGGMTSMPGPGANIYDMSPYNSFSTSAAAQHLGHLQSAAHLGGPQSMPFPAPANNGGGNSSGMTSVPANNFNGQSFGNNNKAAQFDASLLLGDNSYAPYGNLDLSSMDGMNNPFGSMAGGYTMLSEGNNNISGAQPTPIPGRQSSQQMGGGVDGRTPGGSSFSANFIGGPSPADSTGSTSAFFAYTPAMMAADAAMGNNQGSALGAVGGEGSRRKKEGMGDFQLPPSAQSAGEMQGSSYNDVSNRQR